MAVVSVSAPLAASASGDASSPEPAGAAAAAPSSSACRPAGGWEAGGSRSEGHGTSVRALGPRVRCSRTAVLAWREQHTSPCLNPCPHNARPSRSPAPAPPPAPAGSPAPAAAVPTPPCSGRQVSSRRWTACRGRLGPARPATCRDRGGRRGGSGRSGHRGSEGSGMRAVNNKHTLYKT